MLQAETTHRALPVVEQVVPDLQKGPLAHLPSGKFTANAAWLVLDAMAFNLTRAAGCLASASTFATTGALRAKLIHVSPRPARSVRRLVLDLPQHEPWQQALQQLNDTGAGPPATTCADHRQQARTDHASGRAGRTGNTNAPDPRDQRRRCQASMR